MNNDYIFDINKIIEKLKIRRPIFVSEADFQLEIAWIIREAYPNAKVKLEYCPQFNMNMHIDILVVIDNKWIPIELKYKTKICSKIVDNEIYNLKNQSASDLGCYYYLKDIERIEKIKNKEKLFSKGYTIFLTNDMIYINGLKDYNNYNEFSLKNGNIKNGIMNFKREPKGISKADKEIINLNGKYKIDWKDYSFIDNSNSGTFKILVNEIEK